MGYRSCRIARSLTTNLAGDVESVFCLTFSIEYSLFGEVKRVELCPNGQNIPVTKENRERYVELFTEYTLNTSIETQFSAFKYG